MAGWVVVDARFLLDPHGPGLPTGTLDQDGARMLRSYADGRRRIALVGEAKVDHLKHWAEVRGLGNWDDVIGEEASLLDAAIAKRDQYGGVDLVMTGNPGAVRGLLLHGFRVVSLATPAYARDEHRPDYEREVQPWAEVAAQHDSDLAALAADPRRHDDSVENTRFTE